MGMLHACMLHACMQSETKSDASTIVQCASPDRIKTLGNLQGLKEPVFLFCIVSLPHHSLIIRMCLGGNPSMSGATEGGNMTDNEPPWRSLTRREATVMLELLGDALRRLRSTRAAAEPSTPSVDGSGLKSVHSSNGGKPKATMQG